MNWMVPPPVVLEHARRARREGLSAVVWRGLAFALALYVVAVAVAGLAGWL